MRISPLALVCVLATGATAFAPPQFQNARGSATTMNAHSKKTKNVESVMVKPMIAAFAGMTLAGQVAFAALPMPQETVAAPIVQQSTVGFQSSNMLLSGFGAPSGVGGASFETLDFSMPSYGESTAAPKKAEAPPAFSNPFGDVKMPEIGSGDSSADAPSGDEKAAARAAEKQAEIERKGREAEERRVAAEADKAAASERKAAERAEKDAENQRRAEERAAADQSKAAEKADKEAAAQRRADERAAADQAKADEKAAAAKSKSDEAAAADQAKADKAARREAQLQKMKEATARASEEAKKSAPAPAPAPSPIAVPEFKAPVFEPPEIKAPDMPEFKAPEMPKFAMPKVDAPKFEAPKFDAPKFEAPKFDAPKFEAPKFEAPVKVDAPKFEAPKFDAPKFEAPKFDSPKFDMPKAPKINMPSYDMDDAPKVPSMPAFSAPSFGGGAPAVYDGEPQEVRDERAREARQVFLDADKEAKAIEAQAQAVRNIANDKKKAAGALKDEACTTHWGGKILCIRPLNSGY